MKRTPLKRQSCRLKRRIDPEDVVWATQIKDRDGHRCVRCGIYCKGTAQAAHIIPRRFKAARHLYENGVCLCLACHADAHTNEPYFRYWFKATFPVRWDSLVLLAKQLKYRLEKA